MLSKEKLFSGVYGLAVGDALGVPVEFSTRAKRKTDPVMGMREYGTHNQPAGTWSDDTSMVLASLDALSRGNFKESTIMDCFSRWLNRGFYTPFGEVFDVGGTTRRAIERYDMGEATEYCGLSGLMDNGNGALMRMLPLVYYIYQTYGKEPEERAINIICCIARLTHAHDISLTSCVYYVYIGMYIMELGKSMGIQEAIKEAIEEVDLFYKEEMGEIPALLIRSERDSLKEVFSLEEKYVKSSGYVIDSLEASIWCLYNSSTYKEAVLKAVNLGEDTDTIGAITGGLAGLYYGLGGIPKEWINSLQSRHEIDKVINKYFEMYK